MSKKYEINIIRTDKKNCFKANVKDIKTGKTYEIDLIRTYGKNERVEEFKNNNPELNIFDVDHYKDITSIIVTNIPKSLKNDEFYIELCEIDGCFLQYIEDDDKTFDVCMSAVKSNPMALRHVPERHKTDEIIFIALKANGVTLQFVKPENRTEEQCLCALESSPYALRYFPDTLKTLKICIDTVKRDMSCIKYVPDIFLLQVYQESVINMGLALPTKGDREYRDLRDTIAKIKGLLQANVYLNYPELEVQLTLDEDNIQNEQLKELLIERKELLNRLLEIQVKINAEVSKSIPDSPKKKY